MIVFLILLGIIVPIVIVEPMQDSIVLPKLAATAALTGASLIWGAVLLLRGRWPAGRWPGMLWLAVVVFVAVNILALAFAFDWRWSLFGERFRYQGLATTLLYILLFAVAAVSVRTTRDLRWLLFGLFAGGVGVAIYALLQKAGLDFFEDSWSVTAAERPAATLGQANVFGAYLVAVASASIFLIVSTPQRWKQVALGTGVVVMLAALFFTESRSAWLAAGVVAFVAGLVVARWYLPRTRLSGAARLGVFAGAVVPLVIAVVAVFFVGLPSGRISVVSEGTSQQVEGRLSLWRLGVEMMVDRPVFGYGQDSFPLLFSSYRDRPDLPGISTDGVEPESSHNFFIDLASGTGLLGLFSFLGLVGAVFWYAARRAISSNDFLLRAGMLTLMMGIVGYLAAVFFGFSEVLTTWIFWLLLGATAGLGARIPENATGEEAPSSGRTPGAKRSRVFAKAMPALLLTVVGVVALGWAATFVAADLYSARATDASIRNEQVDAARLAKRAVTLNPLQKTYLIQQARAEESSGFEAGDRAAALRRGIEVQETLLRRFEPAASDVIALALGRYQLGQIDGVDIADEPTDFECPATIFEALGEEVRLFECALAIDSFNILLRSFVIDFYEREGFGAEASLQRVIIFCWHATCD